MSGRELGSRDGTFAVAGSAFVARGGCSRSRSASDFDVPAGEDRPH